jgi:signal transduction histidine kinase
LVASPEAVVQENKMTMSVHTQWMELQAALAAGAHPAVDAFGLTYDLLTQLNSDSPEHVDAALAALPAQCSRWPHAAAIRLAVNCVKTDPRRWTGNTESRLEVWRSGEGLLPAVGSHALTSLYLALLCGQLLTAGRVVEGLEVCNRGLRALQLGAHAGAEARLRTSLVAATALLGQQEEAIRLGVLAEDLLVARGMCNWPGRAVNFDTIAYATFEVEFERACECGHCDVVACERAIGLAHRAIEQLRAGGDKRFRPVVVSALHTSARLKLLLGDVHRASSDYRQIDEELQADASLRRFVPIVASGRALIEAALGRPAQAVLLLDDAREALLSQRIDWATLDWWKVRSELMVALGRWQEAHQAQHNYMSTWRAMSRLRAEALATVARRRLDTYNASALQFLSHDLRAPLGSIVALAKASAEGGSPDTMQRLTTLAERASHIAGRSIDYMRALLAEEADFQLLDLTTVLDDACEDTEALGADKFVTLRRDLRGPAWVMGDQDLLRRAFANLLSNAIRFAPDESAVSVTLAPASSESWTVSVADLGPGFDPAQLNLLHAQAHPSSSGHGLGLAFVARAMSKHDATLTVLPNANRGALVQMQFHAAPAPQRLWASPAAVLSSDDPIAIG